MDEQNNQFPQSQESQQRDYAPSQTKNGQKMNKTTIIAIVVAAIAVVALLVVLMGGGKGDAPVILGNTYRVVFNVDGETHQTQEVKEGGYATAIADPTKSGFKFLGWYSNGQKWNFDFNTVNANTMLDAKWQVDFKAMFPTYDGSIGVEIASDGSYMELDTNPYDLDDFLLSSVNAKVEEANTKLGFSDSLYQKMLTTTALQGRQSDENDLVKVQWTYHPDKGLCVIYEIKK